MGRPKGSKNKSKEKEIITEPIIQHSQIKIICQCDKCGANIYSSPYIANFNTLSGKANWWRDNMPVRANLCDKCSKSLSDIIQKWWEE
jgi:hypothetical protein